MADLIERYKITANLPSVLMNYCNRFNSKQLESITEMIYELENSIESADVQPIRHGRWIPQGDDMWLCSNCKENIIFSMHESDRTEKQRYCCRCGARMDLKDGDTNG